MCLTQEETSSSFGCCRDDDDETNLTIMIITAKTKMPCSTMYLFYMNLFTRLDSLYLWKKCSSSSSSSFDVDDNDDHHRQDSYKTCIKNWLDLRVVCEREGQSFFIFKRVSSIKVEVVKKILKEHIFYAKKETSDIQPQ